MGGGGGVLHEGRGECVSANRGGPQFSQTDHRQRPITVHLAFASLYKWTYFGLYMYFYLHK